MSSEQPRDEALTALMREALAGPAPGEALVQAVLERSGDRSVRDWLLHLPEPEPAAAYRAERAILAHIRRERPRRRALPVMIGVAFAGAAAAAGLSGLERSGSDAAPAARVSPPSAAIGAAVEPAAEPAAADAASARDALREAYRLLNLGEGEAAALVAVDRGLSLRPDEADRMALMYLRLSLLDRLDRPEDALTAAADYASAGWPEQRAEVLGSAARHAAALGRCDAALGYLDALVVEFPGEPTPAVDCVAP